MSSVTYTVLPSGVAEEVQPVLEILPLQRLAYEVTVARGQDPDAPRALAKVTVFEETWFSSTAWK